MKDWLSSIERIRSLSLDIQKGHISTAVVYPAKHLDGTRGRVFEIYDLKTMTVIGDKKKLPPEKVTQTFTEKAMRMPELRMYDLRYGNFRCLWANRYLIQF